MSVVARAFAAGVAFPALCMPLMVYFLDSNGYTLLSQSQFFHFLPLIWGFWNALYFKLGICGQCKSRLAVAGALLGLLIAYVTMFVLEIPQNAGMVDCCPYTPLVVVPIAYAAIWAFIVGWMNTQVGFTHCDKK